MGLLSHNLITFVMENFQESSFVFWMNLKEQHLEEH